MIILILVVSGCGSRERSPRYSSSDTHILVLLKDWWRATGERNPKNDVRTNGPVSEILKQSSPQSYVWAAVLYIHAGYFQEAKNTIDDAISKFPNSDGPYITKAWLLFRLAMFDAIQRELIHVEKYSTDSFRSDLPSEYKHSIFEIKELLGDKRPASYQSMLHDAGIGQLEAIRLHVMDPDKMSGNVKKQFERARSLEGSPEYLPRINWNPDAENKMILRLVYETLNLADDKIPLESVEIDREETACLRDRVSKLISEPSEVSN